MEVNIKDIAAYCSRHDWVLGANDPDLIGWLTVIAYLAAAALCYSMSRTIPKGSTCGKQPERVFWFGLAFVLMALGFNKQLDIQTPFLGLSRQWAMAEGWYRERRVVQWVFIACVAMVAGIALVWTGWKLWHGWRDYWLAYAGITFLLGFVLLRASSIDRVNQLLWLNVSAVPGKRHIMELVGIACIGITGLRSLRRARSSNP